MSASGSQTASVAEARPRNACPCVPRSRDRCIAIRASFGVYTDSASMPVPALVTWNVAEAVADQLMAWSSYARTFQIRRVGKPASALRRPAALRRTMTCSPLDDPEHTMTSNVDGAEMSQHAPALQFVATGARSSGRADLERQRSPCWSMLEGDSVHDAVFMSHCHTNLRRCHGTMPSQ